MNEVEVLWEKKCDYVIKKYTIVFTRGRQIKATRILTFSDFESTFSADCFADIGNQSFRLVYVVRYSPQGLFHQSSQTWQIFKDIKGDIQLEVNYVNISVLA